MKKCILTVLKIVFFFIGWAVLISIINIPIDNPVIWRFFAELIPLIVIVTFSVIFLLLEKKEVRIPIVNNIGEGTVIGFIVGIIWIGVSSGLLLLSKQLNITGKNDISMLWLWCLSAFINVIMQELLVRGYIYQLLKVRYNLLTAVIVSTALFTFMHGGAFEAGIIPVINVVTMCLFTTALYESEKTLLAPIMAHAVWNIVGALILGGVSLADDYPHVFTMQASNNIILSGGDCKIEASIITLMLNLALMVVFIIKNRREKKDK